MDILEPIAIIIAISTGALAIGAIVSAMFVAKKERERPVEYTEVDVSLWQEAWGAVNRMHHLDQVRPYDHERDDR